MDENQGAALNVTHAVEQPAKRPANAPPVRVQLSITGKEGKEQREVIRKVTRVHEVVEVDGFVFKRKRRLPPGESGAAQAAASKRARAEGRTAACSSGEPSVHAPEKAAGQRGEVQAAAGEPKQAAQQQQQPPSVDAVEAAQAALAALPQPGAAPEAERLVALCSWLAQGEESGTEGAPGAELLQRLVGSFLDAVRSSLGDGTLQCVEEDAAAAAAVQERALLAQLAAQRDCLAARLARFKQEEAQWKELLAASAAPGADAPDAAGEAADADAEPSAAVTAAAAPAEGAREVQAAAALEETAGADTAEAPGGSGAAAAAPGILQQAQEEVHRTLTFQVEGLCALVEGAQELVARAEQVTSAEFDKLYKRSFSAVPGLNSPARLIREIARPPLSRLQAATAEPATPN